MSSVKSLLSAQLYTIDPWASVKQAATLMEAYGIGCLPVLDEGKLVGIITSRDIKRAHPNRLVADAMTKEVICIKPTASLWEALELMSAHHIERLVVIEKDQPIGIITLSQVRAELGKYVDILTGLGKAELFYQKAKQLLEQGQEIAIIFLDLDNFGSINKKYGHVYGDRILCQAAEMLKKLINKSCDTLCRYAGDEFAILTTQPLSQAEEMARQIAASFENEKWPLDINLSVSIGIAAGRRTGIHELHTETHYLARNLVNLASLASTKAKKLKRPVVVADAGRLAKSQGRSHA
ncbi:MAG: GGDEF domain-containing protein [Moorellaceae bacterium]